MAVSRVAGAASLPFSVAVGTGVGNAVGGAIAPVIQTLQNESWRLHPELPIEAAQAAELVASGERDMAWGISEALNVGVNEERFRALVDMVDTAPPLATLYELWRRNLISDGDFAEGAKKGTVEDKWIAPLQALKRRLLSPDELANAVVQGHRDFGDAVPDAERQGVSAQDFQTMVDNTGLPPGPETLLDMHRRGILTEAEVVQGIREGHTKVKYTTPYLETANRVTAATTAAGLWLRGWLSEAEAKAIGAKTGYGAEEMDHLYLNRGRPATTRQVHIGYARGGALPGAANERAAYEQAVRQSNVRTEYTDILWAQRYTYPSPFVIRALATEGTFDTATTRTILIESGWVPEYADLAARSWTKADSAGPGTKWADRARGYLFTAAHGDYLDGNASEADARALLAAVGVPGAEQTTVINLWNLERQRTRKDLTQAQILKLVKKQIWPADQGVAALVDLGMTAGDADALVRAG